MASILVSGCFLLFYISATLDAQTLNAPMAGGGDSCSSSSDCYPADLNGSVVPPLYINCSDHKCKCWMYDVATRTCTDLRKEQRTAFLLSFFLSITGAANFYIQRYDLGGVQLGIFLLLPIVLLLLFCLILMVIFVIDLLFISRCREYFEPIYGSGGCLWWPILVLSCTWILLVAMWWVTDLFVFAADLRPSGDGCPLKHNL
eukprot:Em0001g1333a